MGAAILHIDPTSSTFTSTHLLFVQLCLQAAIPRLALPVLDKDIYGLPTDPIKNVDEQFPCATHQLSSTFITKSSEISANLKPADVQEYYLLGAQIYIGLRNFPRAHLFLELVLATPNNHTATPLMLEAYKKLLMISLLSTGDRYTPKGTLDQQTHKALSNMSRAYEALADIFKNRDVQRLTAEVDAGTQIWYEVRLNCPDTLPHVRVLILSRTATLAWSMRSQNPCVATVSSICKEPIRLSLSIVLPSISASLPRQPLRCLPL